MLKRTFFIAIILFAFASTIRAQEYFYIKNFDVAVKVNQDASLDVREIISVHFTEPRHGIYRKIPYKYKLENLPAGSEMADIQWKRNGYRYTKIKNIDVKGFSSKIQTDGDYESIRIGSKNSTVDGDQVYEISYTIYGAINFFKDHSELYLNLTGNEWNVEIQKAHFTIEFYKPFPKTPAWFVSTGYLGSRSNATATKMVNDNTIEGTLMHSLNPYEGITAGVIMPKDYLAKPDYRMMGMGWLLLIPIVFLIMYGVWKKWGKDLPVTVQTEYYPPGNISPSVPGYIIDGRLNRRDLTALIPYWGAGGYLKVNEIEEKKLFGLLKDTAYEFIKVKNLDANAKSFEKTMFDGLFSSGNTVQLSSLKDSFYTTMNTARKELETEIKVSHYYTSYSRTIATLLPIGGLFILVPSLIQLFSDYPLDFLQWLAFSISALLIIVYGALMSKKTVKGTELYQKLLGFKEFIKSVEKDRLAEFLKQDPNYFDKVLPYAIVFDMADTWKDKLKGLDVPPPTWYSGNYSGHPFSTMMFMNSLDNSMNQMTKTFYSAPASSGSSGGSFGGGGFSGGGFGGGGGGSW